jgi:hypothetical protein
MGAIVITCAELLTFTTGDVAISVKVPVTDEASEVVNVEVVGNLGESAPPPTP